jgi:(d)CTP diphosphatase
MAVAAAVIVRAGRLLIARRKTGDAAGRRWELPGGKAEEGESLAVCLERELAEELGVAARVGEVLCETRGLAGGRALVLSALRVHGISGEPEARVHDRLAWASPEEWPRYRFLEPDLVLLECIRSRWDELAPGASEG